MPELPKLGVLMGVATKWRGMYHSPDGGMGGMLDLGDIAVLAHLRKGLECHLFSVERRMVFPWPADDMVVVDRHNHIRVGDKTGKLRITFAPA